MHGINSFKNTLYRYCGFLNNFVNFQEIINLWKMVNVIESIVGHLTSMNT